MFFSPDYCEIVRVQDVVGWLDVCGGCDDIIYIN